MSLRGKLESKRGCQPQLPSFCWRHLEILLPFEPKFWACEQIVRASSLRYLPLCESVRGPPLVTLRRDDADFLDICRVACDFFRNEIAGAQLGFRELARDEDFDDGLAITLADADSGYVRLRQQFLLRLPNCSFLIHLRSSRGRHFHLLRFPCALRAT